MDEAACPLRLNRLRKQAGNPNSEFRSPLERVEELRPIACFLREESAFSQVFAEKQIPRSARDDKLLLFLHNL